MKLNKEQKIARKIIEIVNDVTLDLDSVGQEIAKARPITSYNRFILIAESAADEQEKIYARENYTPFQ